MMFDRSELHSKVLAALKQAFPFEKIKESVFVKVDGRNLEFDIKLVSMRCMVECHGEQHYERVSFFHKTKEDFITQKHRDIEKAFWCERNGYTYIEVPYWEEITSSIIKQKILDKINGE